MKPVTFITGNQNKADYLARYLGHPVNHLKINLDELQSLDLYEIVEHKVRQAYDIVKTPVLVEDQSLEFTSLGRLPGTFIKFFVDEVPFDRICTMLDGLDRTAIARCVFGYFDGTHLEFFEGSLKGLIADSPRGENGYGWDKIYIPEGYDITRAEMDEADDAITYLKIKPLNAVKAYLTQG